MKAFTRLVSALGLAAVFCTTVVFAQAPPATTHVKGYTKTMKNGKTVTVKGYNRVHNMPAKMHVKGYTKTLKSGKTVAVKGYTRKAPMKGMKKMMPKPGHTM